VRKIVDNQLVPQVTDYQDGYQYKEGLLQFFPTAEGYVNYTPPTPGGFGLPGSPESYNYVYTYTDHLGNIRMRYAVDPSDHVLKILDETDAGGSPNTKTK
jgi:hypothetical protein